MGMLKVNEETHSLLRKKTRFFKKKYPLLKITQSLVIAKALETMKEELP